MISPSTLRQLEHQREEEHERERIRRMFERAGRSINKSSKEPKRSNGKGGAGFRLPPVRRTRRAPASASQFHFHAKKSKASGAGMCPVSCVNKIKYDLGLDQKDLHKDRVKMVFVAAPEGTQAAACDPLAMAEACFNRARQSKYANSNTGQMIHFDSALPNNLSDDQLAKLADRINAKISQQFGVPCYSGVHLDKGNYHIHSSIPLYQVHSDAKGGFYLGDRINHAKQPPEREALGLPKNPAVELRELRQEVANLIAYSVANHYKDDPNPEQARHQAERWRHGHRTLQQQVDEAAKRGDVQFVLDNLNRQATRKEGPPPTAWRAAPTTNDRRDAAIAHNKFSGKASEIPAPELITKTLVARVVHLAEQANLDKPEELRTLARQAGLNVHWSPGKDGKVQGVSYSIQGGPRIAGGRVGASLGTLKKKLGWAEKPVFRRFSPKGRDKAMDFKRKLIEARLEHIERDDYVEKSIKVTLFRLKKIEDEARKNALPDQLSKPADRGSLGALGAPTPVKKARPKRKSNNPSYHHPSQKSSNVEAPQQAVRQPLTPWQRELLAYAWDNQQARDAGLFDGPLTQTKEQLERAQERLQKHQEIEPWPHFDVKKKLLGLGGKKQVETPEHKQWSRGFEQIIQKIEFLNFRIDKMIKQATTNPSLLSQLPHLERQATYQLEQHQAQAQEMARTKYLQALSELNTARPGSPQSQQAHAAIAQAIKTDPSIAEREKERRAELALNNTSTPLSPASGGRSFQRQREHPR